MTRCTLARFGILFLIPLLLHCSSDDDAGVDGGPIGDGGARDGSDSDGSRTDGGAGGWSIEITPADGTRRVSLERHGTGFLLIEHASSPARFHKISEDGVVLWSWAPESGTVSHFRQTGAGDLVFAVSVDLSGSMGNVIVFTSVDGADGSERWSTRHDFTLAWCRGVCAVEGNNREYIAGFTVSEETIFYSGRYTAEPRHLFGSLDLLTGTNDPTETSDRVSYYRTLFDVPGPGFVGIYQTDTGQERRILGPTWGVDASSATAPEDQHIEHPTGLVSYIAATSQLELIDETGAAQSQMPWAPPAADFALLEATGDSLVLSHEESGTTVLSAATISTGADAWQATFSSTATFDIGDASIAVADPTSTGFAVTWLDRSDGTETDRREEPADVCELVPSGGTSVSVVQLADQTVVAHCEQPATTPILRVRSLAP